MNAIEFRKNLWKDFVANYMIVMVTNPDGFAAYCEDFRKRWIAGA